MGLAPTPIHEQVRPLTGIYLDNNATTPLAEAVAAAMAECDRAGYANPASSHAAGRRARRVIEEARDEIGRLLGADSSGVSGDRVVFTSGGTEANNLAVLGLAAAVGGRHGRGRQETGDRRELAGDSAGDLVEGLQPHAIISAIEHPSVVGPAEMLARLGWRVDRLSVSAAGVVRAEEVERLITADTRLVSVMLGNNETGALQPVAEIAAICRQYGIAVHTDAVQAVGKIAVDFRSLGVDAMTVAAHKFHGPRGIGALVLRSTAQIEPILFGGFQQAATRPGTESVTLAVGMCAALRLWRADAERRERQLRELRDSFEAALRAGWPGLVVNGMEAARLPHTSNVSLVGLDRQALLMALDIAGIYCSTGSACASGSNEPSPVLLAMGCDDAVVGSALRFSFGISNTAAEVSEAVSRILKVANDLQSRKKR
ncbi:MAG: cysteine desulfurase family protein [Pirellulales bacterium]